MKAFKTIGWIGTGVMGKSMCGHLIKAGHTLNVHNRTKSKADELISAGAKWMQPQELAAASDVVVTMLGYPHDVEKMILGDKGIIHSMKKGSYLIDHTTSKPQLAQQIYEECKKVGVYSIDAPVSGGDIGAKEARLVIMCGGDKDSFQQVKPLISVYGKNVILNGTAGKGQHTKMANQILLAGNMIGVVEALMYASKMNLDLEVTIKTLASGGAASVAWQTLGARIVAGNLDPGFYVEHYIKDLQIALDQCLNADLCLPNLALVKQLYVGLKAHGGERLGSQALISILEQMNNHKLNRTNKI